MQHTVQYAYTAVQRCMVESDILCCTVGHHFKFKIKHADTWNPEERIANCGAHVTNTIFKATLTHLHRIQTVVLLVTDNNHKLQFTYFSRKVLFLLECVPLN